MLRKIIDFAYNHKYKILAGVSFALGGYAFYQYVNDETRIKLSSFLEALEGNQLSEVIVKGKTIFFRSQISDWYHTSMGSFPVSELFKLLKNSSQLSFSCQDQQQTLQQPTVLVASAGISYLTLEALGFNKPFKSNKYPSIIDNHHSFDNFYGSEEVKNKLIELAEYLNEKQKYQKLGARLRKGILLHGPPGTGKTMLAKTLANQTKLPFIQTCASEFEQIYVGVGAKKIRQIFDNARNKKEGCIIFIDQLDAIGSRSEGLRFSRQTTATINQLLTELDGFQENQNVVVIGATNRPQLVDSALLRAGRFDLKIKLDLPNEADRKGILKTILAKKQVPNQITDQVQTQISHQSIGWSGADIQTLVNQAIYKAVRQSSQVVKDQFMLQAFKQLHEPKI